ncbi:hypothetical protein TNCT_738331 [Trichonephila clavata]|uniref:Uncharacterized protein n=1 Tax=Trichonephila clavata TaxID=2740835 RepID=A0A8X6KWC7_TRICU|nr:hypothetical protein TNCT_738331 [Trichonephila clavata]
MDLGLITTCTSLVVKLITHKAVTAFPLKKQFRDSDNSSTVCTPNQCRQRCLMNPAMASFGCRNKCRCFGRRFTRSADPGKENRRKFTHIWQNI